MTPVRSNAELGRPIHVGMVECVGRLTFTWSSFRHIRPSRNSNPTTTPTLTLNPDSKVRDIDVPAFETSMFQKSTLWRSTYHNSQLTTSRPLNTVDLAEESTFWESTSRSRPREHRLSGRIPCLWHVLYIIHEGFPRRESTTIL